MGYRYVIWDWNGTLFEDMQICIEVMNKILAENSLPVIPNIDRYRELFCFPVRKYYERLGISFKKKTFEDFVNQYMAGYSIEHKNAKLYNGAVEVLELFSQAGVKQVIISASEKNSLLKQMEPFNINRYFIDIIGLKNNFAISKAELAKNWFKQNGINVTEAIFIGDTIHDFEVAETVGCKCLLIANGHQSKNVLKSVPATVLDDISDAVSFVL